MKASGGRTGSDKERTKLRERQRRAITTKIFHGLRKWGGYQLSPRADINQVLRHLANEAGWVINPDGTTYRATTTPPMNPCPVCGATVATGKNGGGDCSTSASPRPNIITSVSTTSSASIPYFSSEANIPLALYLYGGLPLNPPTTTTTTTTTAPPTSSRVIGRTQQQEMRSSNHNTPDASPLRHPF